LAIHTFNNFAVNKGSGTLTAGGAAATLNINNITLTAGTFSSGTLTNINPTGDWTNNGGTFTPGSSTVNFNNTSAGQNINGSAAIQAVSHLDVDKGSRTRRVVGRTTALAISGNLSRTGGNVEKCTTATSNRQANWTKNSGGTTFTARTGTVNFACGGGH